MSSSAKALVALACSIAIAASQAPIPVYADGLSKIFEIAGGVNALLTGDVETAAPLVLSMLEKHGHPAPASTPQACGYQVRPTPGHSIIVKLGQSWPVCNGIHIEFQASDGNLVSYGPGAPNGVLWTANTGGRGATFMAMQDDGNLVIYAGSTPIWNSMTAGHPGAWLGLNSDGNIVVYDSAGHPLIGARGTATTLPVMPPL